MWRHAVKNSLATAPFTTKAHSFFSDLIGKTKLLAGTSLDRRST
jgi:hypothetical protein